MALTKEILKANANLNGLTDEQIEAIVTLSTNDENSVIGSRIGEIYRNMDATIANATGIARNGDEKTYDYLSRAAKSIAEKATAADAIQAKVTELEAEKARLEKVIKESASDEETKKALEQAKKDLAAVRKQFSDIKAEYDNAKTAHAKELFGIKIDNELTAATANMQYRKDFPQQVVSVIVGNALAKVKGMNPEYIDDGKGGKVLAFKDENGAIMRNPDNMLNPYTAHDLVAKELKTMGVLAEGNGGGGGTDGGGNGGGSGSTIIQGARTRVEAMQIIEKSLAAQGLVVGTEAYQTALDTAWKENNVSQLPEK